MYNVIFWIYSRSVQLLINQKNLTLQKYESGLLNFSNMLDTLLRKKPEGHCIGFYRAAWNADAV